MSSEHKNVAQQEINETLGLCNFCIRTIGLSFIDESPKTLYEQLSRTLTFIIASLLLILLLMGEMAHVLVQIMNATSIEEFVGSHLHIVGYGTLSEYIDISLYCYIIYIVSFGLKYMIQCYSVHKG